MIVDRARVAGALPAYDLGPELGSGGYGLVLSGRHRRLDRDVAIKILSATHDGAHASFESEARVLASLDHPHVVRVYDYVEDDGLCLLIMELLAGGTLSRRRNGMLAEGACAVGLAAAEALSCAHAKGVLHRDMKPDNMLFGAEGLLKVTDFGIAKIFEGSAAMASGVVGTPTYMAPEQITGGRLGPATDVYGLGVVLYELLAGAPPFDPKLPLLALYHHHLDTVPGPPAGVPEPVAELVMRALAKDTAARHPSARAFALDLAEAASRSYGPRWTARAGIMLQLGDQVREAAGWPTDPSDPPTRRPTPPPRPAPGPPPPAGAVETVRAPASPSPPPDVADSRARRFGRRGRAALVAGLMSVLIAVAAVVSVVVSRASDSALPATVDKSMVVALANAERAGCPALTTTTWLARLAQAHAADMAANDRLSRVGPGGKTFEGRAAAVGHAHLQWAENNAVGPTSPAELIAVLVGSPEDRAKLLDCRYRSVGVGYAVDASKQRPYWTIDLTTA